MSTWETDPDPAGKAGSCRGAARATECDEVGGEAACAAATPGTEAASSTEASAYSRWGSRRAAWSPGAGWWTEAVKGAIGDPSWRRGKIDELGV